jgi:hypothetical protein
MKLDDIINRIPGYYKAGVSIYLKSAPGRGKTTTIVASRAVIAKLTGKRIGMSVVNGAALLLTDATGYLVPTTRDGIPHSEFTRPFWWTTDEGLPLEAYDGGIVFIDEMDKCGVDEKKILGEAAESGRLASHKLPPGWVVWGAGNRASDRSGSTKELDHLINRRMEIDVTDDLESWTNWAVQNGVTPETTTFVNQNSNIVFSDGVPEKQGPWATPRSVVRADEYLRAITLEGDKLPSDPCTVEEVSGMIGAGAAVQFFASIRLGQEMPDYKDIIAKPTTIRVPNKSDAQMLVVFNLAARVNVKDVDPVITYVERLPKEFSVTFAKATIKRDPQLINTPAFMRWCQNNSSLVAAIGRI